MEDLWALNAKAKAENEARDKDAARYRWLRERLMAADLDWQESGKCTLVFSWPKECAVSGNCDATIDSAMLVTANAKVTGAEGVRVDCRVSRLEDGK